MRIAMVSEHASPLAALGGVDAGGQNVHVASLSQALAARGHDVDVYTRRDDPGLPERVRMSPGVHVVHVPAGPAEPLPKDELLPLMPELSRRLADHWADPAARPDVAHAHFWMSGVATLRAARRPRPVPVAQTFHALGTVKRRFQGEDDPSPRNRTAIERMLARSVDQVVATCSDEVDELAAMGVVPRDVRVVPCGVDLDLFSPSGEAVPPPGLAGVPAGRRLLTVGRLVERKGVDTVVQALAALPGCHLVVAGGPADGSLSADPEAVRLRRCAREAGVADRVHLVGQVGRAHLPGLLRWADVVVATPWYEPFGIVPLEAMACGRPLVGSAVGGLLDTVVQGSTGLLVPARDPMALTAAIGELLGDRPAREAMGRAARLRAVRRYGWDRVAEDVEAGYAALLPTASRLVAEAM